MRPFKYTTAKSTDDAAKLLKANTNARLLAGGTNILDLMKEDVERPAELIDISRLPAGTTQQSVTGNGISLNAFDKNTETANHSLVRANAPLLSQAILAGASAQIRNMATNGGNLNQRTRCQYFYEVSMPCNKREPGTGCAALKGINKMHAIFGWSENCIAVHPSDMCVGLAALDAVVKVTGPAGDRSIPFTEYHRLPGEHPDKDNNLQLGEVITSIDIPSNNFQSHSYYLKIRDRSSYAFALVSVAAALEISAGRITQARIALGGVAHKPWRATEAEKFLQGKEANEANYQQAAQIAMKDAKAFEYNAFKIPMATKAITRALMQATNNSTNAS